MNPTNCLLESLDVISLRAHLAPPILTPANVVSATSAYGRDNLIDCMFVAQIDPFAVVGDVVGMETTKDDSLSLDNHSMFANMRTHKVHERNNMLFV